MFIYYFRLLPEEGEVVASMTKPTFCGQFSDDGQRFISACQGLYFFYFENNFKKEKLFFRLLYSCL